jgi:hypothetical protein
MLGHSIVSQHFMEPVGSIPNSQQLSICSYPYPDQSSPHHPILPLQDLRKLIINSESEDSFLKWISVSYQVSATVISFDVSRENALLLRP